MVYPKPLSDLAARTTHCNKAAQLMLILKSIVIDLVIVAIEQQVLPFSRRFKNIARPPAERSAARHFCMIGSMSKPESFDDNIGSRAHNTKTTRPGDLCPANGLCGNGNGLRRRAFF